MKTGIDRDENVAKLSKNSKGFNIEELTAVNSINVKPLYTSVGLSANEVLIKPATFNIGKKGNLNRILPFQSEVITPISKEDSLIIPLIVKREEKKSRVTFFITTKKVIKKRLDSLSFDPDLVTSDALALANFLRFLFPDISSAYILFVGSTTNSLVLVEDKILESAYNFDTGETLFPKPHPILLCGDIEKFKPLPSLACPPNLAKHALAIGLAIEAFSKAPIQFRIKEFTAQKEKKKAAFHMSLFIAFSLTLSLALLISTHFLAKNREALLGKRFEALVEKNVTLLPAEFDGPLEEKIERFGSLLDGEKGGCSYIVTAPKVADVLDLIFSQAADLEIVSFHYELKNNSLVKVDLSFKTSSPQKALDFRDAMKKICLPKEGMPWESFDGLYKTSFHLRNI